MKKPYITVGTWTDLPNSTYDLKKINAELNVIAELYSLILPDVNEKNLGRINICLYFEKVNKHISSYWKGNPVCVIEIPFDYGRYVHLNDQEKRIFTLETIITNIREAAEKFNWDIAPFEVAYQKVIEKNYQNIALSKERKPSKNKSIYAAIEVEMDFTASYLRLVFLNKEDAVLKKIQLYEMEPSSMWWSSYVGGLKWSWLNEDEVLVTDKYKEVNFKVSFNNETVDLYYTPDKHPEEFIRNEMEIIKVGKSPEEFKKLIDKRTQLLMVRVGGYFG